MFILFGKKRRALHESMKTHDNLLFFSRFMYDMLDALIDTDA